MQRSCTYCEKSIASCNAYRYLAHDITGYNQMKHFCSDVCMQAWRRKKRFSLYRWCFIAVMLWILCCLQEHCFLGFFLAQGCYMVHYTLPTWNKKITFLSRLVVIYGVVLGAITVLFPLYQCWQELKEYFFVKEN